MQKKKQTNTTIEITMSWKLSGNVKVKTAMQSWAELRS